MSHLTLIEGGRDDSWQDQAACRGTKPDEFFPGEHAYGVIKAAKRICADCPVQRPCLDAALERNEQHGIWGGTTVRERNKMRRAARRPAERVSDAHPDPTAPFAALVMLADEVDTRVRDGLGRYADGAA
jgi:WhiB family redox-sensing transcriptional regulator